MHCTLKLIATLGLSMASAGLALAHDITVAPFVRDGKVAFAIKNLSTTQAITVSGFQIPAQKDMTGPCPANVISSGAVTVPPGARDVIATTLAPYQLIGCLVRDRAAHHKAANLVKVSGDPNEALPPKPGYSESHASHFPYTFESSGPGWKTTTLTAGYVYFQQ